MNSNGSKSCTHLNAFDSVFQSRLLDELSNFHTPSTRVLFHTRVFPHASAFSRVEEPRLELSVTLTDFTLTTTLTVQNVLFSAEIHTNDVLFLH